MFWVVNLLMQGLQNNHVNKTDGCLSQRENGIVGFIFLHIHCGWLSFWETQVCEKKHIFSRVVSLQSILCHIHYLCWLQLILWLTVIITGMQPCRYLSQINWQDFWKWQIVCLHAGWRWGQNVLGFQDFLRKKRGEKKREKDAMVWSDSRRISCLQGVPSNRGTKGNAFRKERGLAYCNTLWLMPLFFLESNEKLEHRSKKSPVELLRVKRAIRIQIWNM